MLTGPARSSSSFFPGYRHIDSVRKERLRKCFIGVEGFLMPNVLEAVGRRALNELDYVGSLNIQLWSTLRAMKSALPLVGNRYRWQATVRQMLEVGYQALPMVSVIAICTGFMLAMQGASELRRFGGLHYVIELVAVGFTRELGPLLT